MDEHRVIEIIDNTSILINYGAVNGAKEGNEIRIIAIGEKVIDPISKEPLGTFDRIKAELTIVTVYEHFSLCRKIKTTTRSALISPIDQFSKTTRTIEKLNVDSEEITNKKPPEDLIIRVGDKVKI